MYNFEGQLLKATEVAQSAFMMFSQWLNAFVHSPKKGVLKTSKEFQLFQNDEPFFDRNQTATAFRRQTSLPIHTAVLKSLKGVPDFSIWVISVPRQCNIEIWLFSNKGLVPKNVIKIKDSVGILNTFFEAGAKQLHPTISRSVWSDSRVQASRPFHSLRTLVPASLWIMDNHDITIIMNRLN